MRNAAVIFSVIAASAFFPVALFGQATYTSVSDGPWNNNATWTVTTGADVPADGIPDGNDVVIVKTGVTVSSANDAGDLTIVSPGVLTLTVSSAQLRINGSCVMKGGTFDGVTGSSIQFNGHVLIDVLTTSIITNISFTQASDKQCTINGTLNTQGSGGVTKTFGKTVINTGASLQFTSGPGGSLNTGDLTLYDGAAIDADNIGYSLNVGGTLTIESGQAGDHVSIGLVNAPSLTVTGPTVINGYLVWGTGNAGTQTFNGTITLNRGGTFDNSEKGYSMVLNCNIVNNGWWVSPLDNSGTGSYTIATPGNYIYSGKAYLNMIRLNILTGVTLTNTDSLVLSGSSAGGLNVSSGGKFVNGSNGYLKILSPGSGIISSGTIDFSSSPNTVEYAYGGAQNIFPSAYSQLITSNSGIKTLTGTVTTNNTLSITGSAIVDTGTNALNGTANLVMTGNSQLWIARTPGTFPELTGTSNSLADGTTIRLNAAVASGQVLKSSTLYPYKNVIVDGITTANLSNASPILGDLTVTGSGSISNFPAVVKGTFIFSTSSISISTVNVDLTVGSCIITKGKFKYSGRKITVNGNNGIWQTVTSGGATITADPLSENIFTAGTGQVINADPLFKFQKLTIDNVNDVKLANSVVVFDVLTLKNGRILTGPYSVFLPSPLIDVVRVNGFVEGTLRKDFGATTTCVANCTVTFEVGAGNVYAPLKLLMSGTGLTHGVSVVQGDAPNISSSLIDPDKSVNLYWSITGATTFTPDFSYPSTSVDGAADPSTFGYSFFDPATCTWTTPVSANAISTSTEYKPANAVSTTAPTTIIQIGQVLPAPLSPLKVYNAKTGNLGWSDKTNWIQHLSGTISCTAGSLAITGSGTNFNSELRAGDVIMLQSSPGVAIGQIAVIGDANNLTLVAPASGAATGMPFGRQTVPGQYDAVHIGNANLASGATTVLLDADASVYSLNMDALNPSQMQTLVHDINRNLVVKTDVVIANPISTGMVNTWDLADGTGVVLQNVSLGTGTTARVAKLRIGNGTLEVKGILKFFTRNVAGAEQDAALEFYGATAGQLNLAGSFGFTNNRGTLNSSAVSAIRFNGTTATQSISVPASNTSSTAWMYNNIICDNAAIIPYAAGTGVLLGSNLSSINFKGNLTIQSGTLDLNGKTIAGSALKMLKIVPGATLSLTGASTFPTTFALDLGTMTPFGTVNFASSSTAIPLASYGNVVIGSTPAYVLASGSTTINGSLTISAGLLSGTAPGSALTVERDLSIASAGTLNTSAITTLSLGGNWLNNGTLSAAAGTVIFTGDGVSQPQIISGSSTDSFYDLSVNTALSSNIVQLQKNVTISHVLTLAQGGLHLNRNDLTVSNGSTAAISRSSGYIRSEDYYPYSSVRWMIGNVTGTYVFPFGKSDAEYIPFTLNISGAGMGSPSGSFSVATYGTGDNNVPYAQGITRMPGLGTTDNTHNVVDRFWIITQDYTTKTPTVAMTFTATTQEIEGLDNLQAQRWSPGKSWDRPLPGQLAATNGVTVPNVNRFSPWTISGDAQVLPVHFLDFTAKNWGGGVVELNWTTAMELNTDRFEIERSSDGKDFIVILQAKSKGSLSAPTKYSLTDDRPLFGQSYYRLREVDVDGSFEYFDKVISVRVDEAQPLSVYPNPAPDNHVVIELPVPGLRAQVILSDMMGRVVFRKEYSLSTKESFIEVVFDDHRAQMYLLTLMIDDRTFHAKVSTR